MHILRIYFENPKIQKSRFQRNPKTQHAHEQMAMMMMMTMMMIMTMTPMTMMMMLMMTMIKMYHTLPSVKNACFYSLKTMGNYDFVLKICVFHLNDDGDDDDMMMI